MTENNNVQIAYDVLEKSLTRQMDTYLNVCAHCGMCNDSCHYFVAMGDPKKLFKYSRHEPTYSPSNGSLKCI